jgi:hypothetical protein
MYVSDEFLPVITQTDQVEVPEERAFPHRSQGGPTFDIEFRFQLLP